MAKNKSGETPKYELLYIIPAKFTEDEIKTIEEKIDNLVKHSGAEIVYKENLGKKKLAYPIKGFSFGYYNLLEFNCEGRILEKINRDLRLTAEVIRHIIVAKPIKSEQKLKEEREISKKIAEKTTEAEKREQEKKEAKGKVDLKELDKKLDKILDTDDLL